MFRKLLKHFKHALNVSKLFQLILCTSVNSNNIVSILYKSPKRKNIVKKCVYLYVYIFYLFVFTGLCCMFCIFFWWTTRSARSNSSPDNSKSCIICMISRSFFMSTLLEEPASAIPFGTMGGAANFRLANDPYDLDRCSCRIEYENARSFRCPFRR